MNHDELMARWGDHPAVLERLNETSRFYQARALQLEHEADLEVGKDRIDLLTAARGAAKLAATYDSQDKAAKVAKMWERMHGQADLVDDADAVLQ